MSRTRAKVFIGSSKEQLPVARAVNTVLDYDADCNLWTHGFDPGKYTLEALEDEIRKSDFAVFILTGDDVTISRGRKTGSPRDNVIFELGISIGVLTRRRTFLLIERARGAKIPSDLLGFTPLSFERRAPLTAAVEGACNSIREQLHEQGLVPRSKAVENIIAYGDRSLISTGFANQALRTLSTFAGDLSWLDDDLRTYRSLRKRNVAVRFLTDTPTAAAIEKAKKCGIAFRQYPQRSQAPLKATLADTDSESDARALVVRRYVPAHSLKDGAPYQYWMKVYRGTDEYPVIKGLWLLFEALWAKGKLL